jgi:hypothetical protein
MKNLDDYFKIEIEAYFGNMNKIITNSYEMTMKAR